MAGRMKIELHDKGIDRNYSLHFFPENRDEEDMVRGLVYEIHRNIVDCFLQGDTGTWMMIEFWSSDQDKILKAVEYVEKYFNIQVK